jgi:hypothetical protein
MSYAYNHRKKVKKQYKREFGPKRYWQEFRGYVERLVASRLGPPTTLMR